MEMLSEAKPRACTAEPAIQKIPANSTIVGIRNLIDGHFLGDNSPEPYEANASNDAARNRLVLVSEQAPWFRAFLERCELLGGEHYVMLDNDEITSPVVKQCPAVSVNVASDVDDIYLVAGFPGKCKTL